MEVGAEHCELKDLETLTPLDVSVIQGMKRKQLVLKSKQLRIQISVGNSPLLCCNMSSLAVFNPVTMGDF